MPAKRRGGGRRGHRGVSKAFRAAPVVASLALKRSRSAEQKAKPLIKKGSRRHTIDTELESDDDDEET